ncbi:pfEMP1 [Plasmodium falciparum HB3]|uniref:PfEMP1 n=1 Tax=Plasmodium falciparum (isolate HB3) TaxID=137071 RepID=A0A0L7KMY8_PLAFX|nr:pfEMP1 [Plasmodium falciparum HB3]
MTCSDELTGASYFHATCIDGNSKSQAKDKCRCQKKDNKPNDQVPTYFDYVPQYLRWFEEWAEEFCRKKKKKLEKLEQQCRGKYQDADRYCSRNGFDCEKTVNARGKVRMGKGCTDCFFACNPYIDWINNQKEQFDKQKNKYKTEISDGGASGGRSGNGRQRRAARNENYKGYEKKFYDKLEKNKYGKVDGFLDLLTKEDVCIKNKWT